MIRRTGIFLRTSVGKKVLMSLTGIALLGFLVVHLAGNTLLYAGDGGEAFDGYANALKSKPLLLYTAEIGLLALFVAHIVLALRLTLENRDARPERYRIRSSHGEKTVGSTSMIVTGSVVLVFLVIHLLDFRLDSRAEDGMYVLVVERLSTFAGFAIYMVGVGALLIHLGHAVRSALQSLGVNHPQYNAVLKIGGRALAVVLFLGFASFPIAVQAGLIGMPAAAESAEAARDGTGTSTAPTASPTASPTDSSTESSTGVDPHAVESTGGRGE